MTLEEMLKSVSEKLKAGGMDENAVKAGVEALKDAYGKIPEKDLQQRISSVGGPDGIAGIILRRYKNSANTTEEAPVIRAPETPVTKPDKPSKTPLFDDAEKTETKPAFDFDSVDDNKDKVSKTLDEIERAGEPFSDKDDDVYLDDEDVEQEEDDGEETVKVEPPEKTANKSNKKKPEKKYKQPESKAAAVLIIVLLALAIAAITLVFAALYLFAIALVIAVGAALVIVSAAGTAIAICAIVYGVIQILQGVPAPIGIYEIGLGVILGGITLGIAILLYNFIVRFIPFLFKKMFVLYKFICRKLSEIMSAMKGE